MSKTEQPATNCKYSIEDCVCQWCESQRECNKCAECHPKAISSTLGCTDFSGTLPDEIMNAKITIPRERKPVVVKMQYGVERETGVWVRK